MTSLHWAYLNWSKALWTNNIDAKQKKIKSATKHVDFSFAKMEGIKLSNASWVCGFQSLMLHRWEVNKKPRHSLSWFWRSLPPLITIPRSIHAFLTRCLFLGLKVLERCIYKYWSSINRLFGRTGTDTATEVRNVGGDDAGWDSILFGPAFSTSGGQKNKLHLWNHRFISDLVILTICLESL